MCVWVGGCCGKSCGRASATQREIESGVASDSVREFCVVGFWCLGDRGGGYDDDEVCGLIFVDTHESTDRITWGIL